MNTTALSSAPSAEHGPAMPDRAPHRIVVVGGGGIVHPVRIPVVAGPCATRPVGVAA
jgi:hypothetical protein